VVQLAKMRSKQSLLKYFIHFVLIRNIQYCAKEMRANFDEKLRKSSKMNDISNQTNFLRIFEAAIVLPFAKNHANLRKVGQNFECHFADSSEFSQLNSKRASKSA